jgi:hypothetical protein
MRGRKERGQLELVITGSLQDLVPEDRGQVRVDDIPDLSWLPGAVAGRTCAAYGRPDIDAEVAARLMLAGLLCGIVHDRPLMRKAQVNLAIRWFIGCALHAALPDHSALTRIRHCWGEDVFHRVLTPVVATVPVGRTGSGGDGSHRRQSDPGECQHGCAGRASS